MRLLLDSHVVLWWLGDDPELGPKCRDVIRSADEVVVSAVTPWELGVKKALGKLEMPNGLVEELASQGFRELSIEAIHAERAPALPMHHPDLFDRMLIAQAQLESLTLVTADRQFDLYDIPLVDARQ